ncbi:MAG: hypothetical protein AB7K04_01840 [Pseudorhodoplanes sp.]
MRIDKHSIHNVDRYLAAVPAGASFRIAVAITTDLALRLERAGFPPTPQAGATILPATIGPVSRFNAEGGWNVRRDLPKESRYVRTVWWRWRQWAGRHRYEDHEDTRDIYRDCYPRERIDPPSAELTWIERDSRSYVVSEVLTHIPENAARARHVINLFLELFGTCEVLLADLARLPDLAIRKVNWRMLPPGEYPWERLAEHIRGVMKGASADALRVIEDRQTTIKAHGPDEMYVGEGGFSDYIAYRFRPRGLTVMESVRRDNAIYVFGDEWERVSRLTKAQVLSSRHHKARVIHAKGWKARLAELLKAAKAA